MRSSGRFDTPAVVPERQHYEIRSANPAQRPGTLLVMPAWRVGASLGIKLVTIYPDNALRSLPAVAATYVLLDAETGRPKALLDGGELTLRRTGAASALASRFLCAPEASRLLMVGTGRLAPHLIESHALVRPIREIRIWGRNAMHARSLAAFVATTRMGRRRHGGSGERGALGPCRELRHAIS